MQANQKVGFRNKPENLLVSFNVVFVVPQVCPATAPGFFIFIDKNVFPATELSNTLMILWQHLGMYLTVLNNITPLTGRTDVKLL